MNQPFLPKQFTPNKTATAKQPQPRMDADDLARRLNVLLDSLRMVQEGILSATQRQREAMRTAQPMLVKEATHDQARHGLHLKDIERERNLLVNEACDAGLGPAQATSAPVTLRMIATSCPSDVRERITRKADSLRTLMEQVSKETRTTRAATQTLLAHVEGLMRQVASRLSHTGTYSRKGTVDVGAAVMSAIDMRQ